MSVFIHPLADVASDHIGDGTGIGQFVIVLEKARIGEDCHIGSHCSIENDVVIGDRVTINFGVHVWDGLRIEDDVVVGPNVSFAGEPNSQSQTRPDSFIETVVKKGASIGANSTILPGMTIGAGAMIEAGSVVAADVPAGTVVAGNPARILRYCQKAEKKKSADVVESDLPPDCGSWFDVQNHADMRGQLSVVEWGKCLPFEPKRTFFVHQVPNEKVRGEHAHKECQQALLCLAGSLNVVVDNANERYEVTLEGPKKGLVIPAGIWASQYKFRDGAILAVFASHDYDESDYIRNYDDFLKWKSVSN